MFGRIANPYPNYRRTFIIKGAHGHEILILGNQYGSGCRGVRPNISVGCFGQAEIENVHRLVPVLCKIACQAGRQLGIN